jgi:hypothetical protein
VKIFTLILGFKKLQKGANPHVPFAHCTLHCMHTVVPGFSNQNSGHSAVIRAARFPWQTEIISLNGINRVVFVIVKRYVFCAVRGEHYIYFI